MTANTVANRRNSVTSGSTRIVKPRSLTGSIGRTMPPMISAMAGGKTLAVIIGVRPLQDGAKRLGEHDHGDARRETEPGAEAECAVQPKMRVMVDREVHQYGCRQHDDRSDPEPFDRACAGKPVVVQGIVHSQRPIMS